MSAVTSATIDTGSRERKMRWLTITVGSIKIFRSLTYLFPPEPIHKREEEHLRPTVAYQPLFPPPSFDI